MLVPFKIFADSECNLRGAESHEGSYTKNIKIMFLVVLFTKFFVLMIDLQSQLLFREVKMQLMNLLKQLLRSISVAKSNKQHFNKNVIMIEEEEHLFQQSNSC